MEYVHKIKRARLSPQEQPRSNQVAVIRFNTAHTQIIKTENQENSAPCQESIKTGAIQMATTDLTQNGEGGTSTSTLSQESVTRPSTSGLGTVIASSKSMASTSSQGISTIPTLTSVNKTKLSFKPSPKCVASTPLQETPSISTPKSVASTSTMRIVPTITSSIRIVPKIKLAPISVVGTKRKYVETSPKYIATDLSRNGKGGASTPTLPQESVTCPSTSRVGTVIASSKYAASTSTQGILTKPPPISKPSTSSQRKASTKSTQKTLDAASSPKCGAGTSTQKRVANTSSNKGIIKAKKAEAEQDIPRVPLIPCDYDALRECVSHFPKDENGYTMPLLYQSKADMDLFSSKFDELESKNNQKVKKTRAVQIPPYAMIYQRINELKKGRAATPVNRNDDFIDKNIAKKVMRQEYEKLPREVLENCEKAKIRTADLQLKYISKMLAEKPIDTTYHPNKAREFIKCEGVSAEKAEARKINNQKSRESRMKAKKRLLIYRGSNLFLKEQISDIISQYTMLEEMLNNDEDDGKLMEIISKSHVEDRYEHEFMGSNDDGTQFGSYQPTSQNEISPVEMDSSDEEYYRMPLEVVIKQE